MIGSVVFYKKDKSSFLSEAVALFEKGEFSHVAIVTGYDENTKTATIIEANGFIKTRVSTIEINDEHLIYSVDGLDEETSNKIVEYAHSKLGTKYDYWQIIGLAISLTFKWIKRDKLAFFNSKNKFICSELVDIAYYTSGVKRKSDENIGDVTPQELLGEYDFTEFKP